MKKIVLGTVQFGVDYGVNNGKQVPRSECFKILEHAWLHGVRELDTAQAYGESERVIGEYIVNNSDKPFLVNTKICWEQGVCEFNYQTQILKSLERLQLNKLSCLSYHSYKDCIQGDSNSIEKLKSEGLIDKIGVSVYRPQELSELMKLIKLDVVQIPYNMLTNNELWKDVLQEAQENNIEVHARSIYLQGLFYVKSGKLQKSSVVKEIMPQVSRLQRVSEEIGVPINHLGLQYVFNEPLINKVLIGVDSKKQLEENLKVINSRISSDVFREIQRINVVNEEFLYPMNW